MVMIEKRTIPPAAIAWARNPKKDGQSAVPVSICAFVVIRPSDLAASGSFRITMKSPPANGAMQNPMAVNSGTLERVIFKVSENRAAEKLVIAHLRSGAGNAPRDLPVL